MALHIANQKKHLRLAGILLVLVGIIAFMGIITAEATYPGYSTADNMISDLGGTEPPDSIVLEPASTIFNATMAICGIMLIGGAYLIHLLYRRPIFSVFFMLFGAGVLGVGVFPGDTGDPHALAAMTTFLCGSIAAITAYAIEEGPLRLLSVALGAVSLATLLLYIFVGESSHPLATLGVGGIERWVAYPLILWVLALGGYLLGRESAAHKA
ncbi:DUF998 domain-containing protein [archaeon]|nr:MAG: DUF998 domain-containing protein [archaeon]